MGKHHDHNKQGFANGHDTLKITVTYEGHPAAIDDAIHGATREHDATKAELEKADAAFDKLVEVNNGLMADLFVITLTVEDLALELAAARAARASLQDELDGAFKRVLAAQAAQWAAEDAKCAAERRETDTRTRLTGEINNKNSDIAAFVATLAALGMGEISVEDIAAFVSSRKLSNPALEIGKPKVNPNGPRHYFEHNYPFALLLGEKEDVMKQVLDCFVNDPCRSNKIQAIRVLRERSDLGLKESKDLVEWAIGTHFTDR